jgi:protein-tyrosine phosphatase
LSATSQRVGRLARIRASLGELRRLEPGARGTWLRLAVGRLLGDRSSEQLDMPGGSVGETLFLCHGNIYRSPFAEAAFRREVRRNELRCRVSSAGLHAVSGRPVPDDAVAEARRVGIVLDSHQSSTVDAARLSSVDLVVVIDRANEAVLRSRFPQLAAPVVLLGAFARADGEPTAIADPYGRGEVVLARCYARIDRAVRALADAMAAR